MGTLLVFQDDDMRGFLSGLGLSQMDDFLLNEGGQVIRKREGSMLRRHTLVHNGRQETLFIKTYDYARLPRWRRLGTEKATREARNYLLLRGLGVEVPEVIAYGQRYRRGLLRDGMVITREVPHGAGLEQWFLGAAQTARRQLLEQSAKLIRRMHTGGFFHIDLQWRNIMMASPPGASARLVLLDCPRGGCRWWPPTREYARLRDLSSLYKDARRFLSPGEMIRWLRGYLGMRKIGPRERLMIWTILRDRAVKDNPTA